MTLSQMEQLSEYEEIENLVYDLDIKALKSLTLSENGEYMREQYLKSIAKAPYHEYDKCMTHVFYGNCPPWPHS